MWFYSPQTSVLKETDVESCRRPRVSPGPTWTPVVRRDDRPYTVSSLHLYRRPDYLRTSNRPRSPYSLLCTPFLYSLFLFSPPPPLCLPLSLSVSVYVSVSLSLSHCLFVSVSLHSLPLSLSFSVFCLSVLSLFLCVSSSPCQFCPRLSLSASLWLFLSCLLSQTLCVCQSLSLSLSSTP